MHIYFTVIRMIAGICLGFGILFLFIDLRRKDNKPLNHTFVLFALCYAVTLFNGIRWYQVQRQPSISPFPVLMRFLSPPLMSVSSVTLLITQVSNRVDIVGAFHCRHPKSNEKVLKAGADVFIVNYEQPDRLLTALRKAHLFTDVKSDADKQNIEENVIK